MAASCSGKIIDAGCDWITVSTKTTTAGECLSRWTTEVMRWYRDIGFNRRGWGMSGFSGFQCGPVQLGVRNDECLVRLSSDAAQRWWHEAYRMAEGVSRFDVQVTHVNDVDAAVRVRRHHKEALTASAKSKRGPCVTLIASNDGTSTLYLGKRASNRYGRIYTKGHQKNWQHDREAVRYEVEFKEGVALIAARTMAAARSHPSGAGAQVSGFFANRGVSLPSILERPIFIKDSPYSPDHHRTLEWLRSAVAPTVRRLIDANMGVEVMEALGLVDQSPTDLTVVQ